MTAQLVDQTMRRPLTVNGVEFLASIRRGGDLTAKNGQVVREGQLWSRLADA
jgi:hypothetical protein